MIGAYRADANGNSGRLLAVVLANVRRAFEWAGAPYVSGAAAPL